MPQKSKPVKESGRPRKIGAIHMTVKVDKKEVVMTGYDIIEQMGKMACTEQEIASFLGVHIKTIERDEKAISRYRKGLDTAKSSLRRKQMEVALSGNVVMLIWLGKQLLGQKDSVVTTHLGDKPIRLIQIMGMDKRPMDITPKADVKVTPQLPPEKTIGG